MDIQDVPSQNLDIFNAFHVSRQIFPFVFLASGFGMSTISLDEDGKNYEMTTTLKATTATAAAPLLIVRMLVGESCSIYD